ncbi:MAG: DUF4038 domain-containing protein, partial [Thermoanaerobaculia bacterium]
GTRAVRMDVTQSGDTAVCSGLIAVSPNSIYSLSAWLNASLGRQAALRIIEWRSDFAVVADKTVAVSPGTQTGWAEVRGNFVSGSSTSYVQIRLMHSVPGTAGTGTFFWDDVDLRPGDPEAPNPSFELGPPTAADGWARCQTSGSSVFSIVSTPVHTGMRAVKMDVTQSGDTGVCSSLIVVASAQDYMLSAWIKAPLGRQAALRVIEWDANFAVLADKLVAVSSGETTDWESFEGHFASGAATRYVQIRLMHSVAGTAGTGAFIWDDIGLQAVSGMFDELALGACPKAPTPPVCNESSTVNQWQCWQKTLKTNGYAGTNTYRDLELTVEIRDAATNALVRSGWGFWDCTQSDGKEVFRIRTALPAGSGGTAASYKWEAKCRKRTGAPSTAKGCATDPELNGPSYVGGGKAAGTFTVNPATVGNDRYDRGFLTMSVNGRFLRQGNTSLPFFWLADTAWPAVKLADRATDWATYIDSRKKQGFSVILLGTAPHFGGLSCNGGACNDGVTEEEAFHKLSGCTVDSVVPHACSRWNASHWQKLEAKVQDANAKGLEVLVAGIMEPFAYKNPTFGKPEWLSIFGRNLAARLAGYHVILSPGFDHALTPATTTLADSVGAALDQAVGTTLTPNVPSHLITHHLKARSTCGDYLSFQTRTWHDFQMFQSGHCEAKGLTQQPTSENVCDPRRDYSLESPEACVTRRARGMAFELFGNTTKTKPVVNGEAVYDGNPASPTLASPPDNRDYVRQTAYLTALSGSFGFTYGADYFSLWKGDSSTLAANLGPVPGTPGTVPSAANHSAWDMQRMASIFKLRPWKELVPEPVRILNQQTADDKKIVYAHTNNYNYNLAYLPAALSKNQVILNLNGFSPAFTCAGGEWTITWMNPLTTEATDGKSSCLDVGSGSFRFDKPNTCLSCEWVLSIDRTASSSSYQPESLETWPEPNDQGAALAGQLLTSSGHAIGDRLVLTHSSDSIFRRQPFVAREGGGNYLVVWEAEHQDGSLWGVIGRWFDNRGRPLGDEHQINTYSDRDQAEPAAAASPSGDAVVVWMSFEQDGDLGGIFGQRFDHRGNPEGGEFQVNTTVAGHQGSPLLASAANGDFVVAWESEAEGGGKGIFAQRFSRGGIPDGLEIQVAPPEAGEKALANIEVRSDGGFVVTWYEYNLLGESLGLTTRTFNRSGIPQD